MIPKWAYYLQQGAGEGLLVAATCGSRRCYRLGTFSVQIYVQKPRGMTEQLNNTRVYYHNVEAETVIWVRLRDHHERCALTSPKTTALKESRREYWIGPRDDDIFFFFKNERQQIEFVLHYLCMLIAVPLVIWGPPSCPVCKSPPVLLPAATLYTFIKNPEWRDALGTPVGLLAQIIFSGKKKKVKVFTGSPARAQCRRERKPPQRVRMFLQADAG